MVAVAVRHHNIVQFGQIDSFRFAILCQDVRIVPGIEQNPFPAIFDESGIAPIFLHRRMLAKGIVQNRDSGLKRNPLGACVTGMKATDERKEQCEEPRG
jgi:hypothetical protein